MAGPEEQTPKLPPPPQIVYVKAPGNGMATTGGVLGIVGLTLGWALFVPLVLGPLAVVFGGIGLARARTAGTGKGMAITGLVCGILAIGAGVFWISMFTTPL